MTGHDKPFVHSTSDAQLSPADRLAALRIIDANLNRASEGLRVVEESCRFVLEDAHLSEACKVLRHDLAAAARFGSAGLMAARDTLTDVGTSITAPAEQSRTSLAQVAAASWQRIEQALRAIEEYGKLLDPAVAAAVESLRYRAYTLAKACAITANSQQQLAGARLYVLIDGGSSEAAFAEHAQQLIAAGVHVFQLRDKTLDDRTLLSRARLLRRLTTTHNSPLTSRHSLLLIINDRPDIAVLCRADGVHVGQEELSVGDVRRIVGPEMLVGVSTHTIEQARQAVLDGANYIGCGPTFPSGTKQFERFAGLDFLRQVAAEISLPAFAIGGITQDNVADVLATGFSRIAVSGAIANAPDLAAAVNRFLDALARV